MWRHEDFFYGCCLGGSPLDPIKEPGEIVRKPSRRSGWTRLVLGPLMHGGGAVADAHRRCTGGNSRSSTASGASTRRGSSTCRARARRRDRHHRRRDGAADRGGARWRIRGRWDLVVARYDRQRRRDALAIGEGAAARERFPNAMIIDSYRRVGDRRAGSEFGDEHGERRGRRSRPTADTSVLDPTTLEPLEPGSGEIGLLARRGHIPLGYYKDAEKTAGDVPLDVDGVRWSMPGDYAPSTPTAASRCSAADRAASTPAARRSSPKRSRPRSRRIPTCSTRSSSACPTSAGGAGRRARAAARGAPR